MSKSFGRTRALDALDLEIGKGEFVSILGPSGCGKTTLLRLLAGLEQPSSGTISINGAAVNDLPPSKRDIAMVFQTYALYPHMSVRGNIEYPLKKRRVPKTERAGQVAEAAALLQVEHLLDRKPRQLSGGQQQRVALGRALVRKPAVFLLDEPLSNLDAKLRAHMRAELIRLHRKIGRTMVYVTHDQLEAMTMSDRIAVIRDGKLQQYDTPRVVYSRPANEFVGGFIGTPAMNIVEGSIGETGGRLEFRAGEWSLPLDDVALTEDTGGGSLPARLGFRPEDLRLDEAGIRAHVAVVEPTGPELIVVFELGGVEITGRLPPDTAIEVGEEVNVLPRRDRLHVFSADDGRRINDDR